MLLPSNPTATHSASFQQEYHEVQKLISVGLSDRECSVRSCLLESLDERYDPYLIQVYSLYPIYCSLRTSPSY